MENLSWQLDVLSRSVQFKNLTAASQHVGLSQPQLSRIMHQLEEAFSIALLDRKVKRQSVWTPQAHQLAHVYVQHRRRLENSILELQESGRPKEIHIGTLEGLASLAIQVAKILFDHSHLELIFLDVYDQNDLEAKFLSGDLDLILSSRTPGKSKLKHELACGYQSLDIIETNSQYNILSGFEFGRKKRNKKTNNRATTFVSNSLLVRQSWLSKFGGRGSMPSAVQASKKKGPHEVLAVLLIGSETLHREVWDCVVRELAHRLQISSIRL